MRFPVLLTTLCLLLAPPAARAEAYTIFLLDVSGSMEFPVAKGKRLDRAKEAILDSLSTGEYPAAELIMWNSEKFRDGYGDDAQLARQLKSAPRGHRGSSLGSALLSISDAGTRCAHVVFVTDEYPDDEIIYTRALLGLLDEGRQNTVTVYVVDHPMSRYYSERFTQANDSAGYRVVDGHLHASLAKYLEENPATDSCGTLS